MSRGNDKLSDQVFQVFPRILIGPFNSWHPTLYAEDDFGLGLYEKQATLKNLENEKKYWKYLVKDFEGKKYLWITEGKEIKFYQFLKNKLVLKVTKSEISDLIAVIQGDFVINNLAEEKLELWGTKGKEKAFVLLSTLKLGNSQDVFYIGSRELMGTNSNLHYRFIKVINRKFIKETSFKKDLKLGKLEDKTGFYRILVINPNELVVFLKKMLIFSSRNKQGEFQIEQTIEVPYKTGYLHSVTPSLFLLDVIGKLEFYMKKNSTWIKFEMIPTLPAIHKAVILPPGREELIRKAKLLVIPLPLELKISVTEFLY
jgi:hypothetical protein